MGRAPTSGNCHTCRMRRVKCDRARPACERCLKAGYECKGYETVLRIQSHSVVAGSKPGTARLAKIQTVSSFPAAGPDEPPLSSVKAKRQQQHQQQLARARNAASVGPLTLQQHHQQQQHTLSAGSSTVGSSNSGRRSIVYHVSASSASGRAASTSPPPELSLAGFVDDIAFSYFFDSYGWINMHSIMLQDSGVRGTLSDGDMAHDSLRALAYGLLGKDRHSQSLQSQAARLYGNTLRKLRAKLSTQSKDELAALIKPIAIMGSYLISVEDDLRFTHHRGLSRILEYCGPQYFQSPSLLPIFDSCRLTMISNCIVRRTPTFLSNEEWRTVPWEKAPHLKTWTSKLLDIMADVPNMIAAVLGLMDARITWHSQGFPTERAEDPDEIPSLQRRVDAIKERLANWRMEWEAAHPGVASQALAWAFSLTGDDQYRPGILGYAGPDLYDYSVLNSPASRAPPFLRPDQATFTLMQELSLYTTVLVWTARLTKYLVGAAVDHGNIDFYNSSFSTTCNCCTSKLATMCDTVPDSDADVLHVSVHDPDMSWNFTAARIAIAPIRVSPSDEKPVMLVPMSPEGSPERDVVGRESPQQGDLQQSPQQQQAASFVRMLAPPPSAATSHQPQTQTQTKVNPPQSPPLDAPELREAANSASQFHPKRPAQQPNLPTPPGSATFAGGATTTPAAAGGFPQRVQPLATKPNPPLLLPGDVRFSSQLRVLSWLTDHLPASRPQVLATLASIGLGHCGHDVRPVDGLPEVAGVVRNTLYRTNFEHADHILLRRYR